MSALRTVSVRVAAALSLLLSACAAEVGEEPTASPEVSQAALTSSPDPLCAPASYGGHDYWLCPTLRTWSSARAQCQAIGYDLATIETSGENQFLLSKLLVNAWIGANDQATEGKWRWAQSNTQFWQGAANGSAVGGAYRNWGVFEPNNLLNQDCAIFRGGLGLGTWSDENCGLLANFVCEGDLCPNDPNKTELGQCGCGVADTDSDGDGTADCVDACVNDPGKTAPGDCGCGTSDADSDNDGVTCEDLCPNDQTKTAPGDCGCADSPLPSGTSCSDGLCVENTQCNGAGSCGTASECGAPDSDCEYRMRAGTSYWFCDNDRTFADAEARCQSKGMELVTIESAGEDAFITQHANEHSFLGGSDQTTEGTWEWLGTGAQFWSGGPSGNAIGGAYTNFAWGEPSNLLSGNDCLVKSLLTGGQWKSHGCSLHDAFVCERPPLDLLASGVQQYPETGAVLRRYVFHSRATGAVTFRDIDANGQPADERVLAEAERVARIANHGRIDPALEAIVATMAPNEKRWVLVWVPVPESVAGAGSNVFRDPEAAAWEEARVRTILSDTIPVILASLPSGTPVSIPGGNAPFISVQIAPSDIMALAHSDNVGNLYDGESPEKVPLADVCSANHYFLTKTDQTHDAPYSLDGSGVKVATFEQVCANQYLPFDPTDPVHSQVPQSCTDPADHGALVLGYVANTSPNDPEDTPPHPTLRGFAPGAELFSANAWGRADAFAWLATNGIAIANFSFYDAFPLTCPHPRPQSLTSALSDYYATHPPFLLSVAAAGNHLGLPEFPCLSNKVVNVVHNGLVVGAAFPHQVYTCDPTCGYTYAKSYDRTLDWTRQTATGSLFAWLNPDPTPTLLGVGDHELPHIVAYNRVQDSVYVNVACEATGTSVSAPQVTGAAVLVAQANPELYGRPEAMRAVLMAGADVNTDLNTPGYGAAYSYFPLYNDLGFGGGTDRRGGVGLLNTLASVQIAAPAARFTQDNRFGEDPGFALLNTSAPIQAYQELVTPSTQPELAGHDYGVMDPAADFESIWYKHFYYFRTTVPANLRIVLTWNRPYSCTFGPTSCGPDSKPDLNMLLRDLSQPDAAVQTAHTWDPAEEFIAAPVVPGKLYRLDIYKQNHWPGPMSFALAAHLTTNPQ